jgi:hypothetical protein
MDPKPRPNQQVYLQVLRAMTPDERLRKALELTQIGRILLADGLRQLHPGLADAEFRRLYLDHLDRCRSRSF